MDGLISMNDEQNQRTQATIEEIRSLKYGVVFSAALVSVAICAPAAGAIPLTLVFVISGIILIAISAVIIRSWFSR
jgi:hypothetical protein